MRRAPDDPAAARPRLRAAANLAAATALFVAASALVKLAGGRYPVGEVVLCRGVFSLIPLAWVASRQGGWGVLRARHPRGLLARSAAGIAAMACTFAALPLLPLAEAAAIGFTAPLLTVALAGPLLGEPVGVRRWAAVAAGFAGVLVVAAPGAAPSSALGAVLALAGAFFGALVVIAIRALGEGERAVTVALYYSFALTAAGALTLPFAAVVPTLADLPLLAGVGLLGGAAQIFLTNAYRSAPASFLAPFEYTALLWSVLLDALVWVAAPSVRALAGAALVAGAGIAALRAGGRSATGPAREPAPAEHRSTGT